MSVPSLPSAATISFLDANSKSILNGINSRLNEIDLKLSLLVEMFIGKLSNENFNPQLMATMLGQLNRSSMHAATNEHLNGNIKSENNGTNHDFTSMAAAVSTLNRLVQVFLVV